MTSSETLVNTELPLTEGKKEKRRVVYSIPIPAPRKGEVLAFDASFDSDISGLRFNTFIASRVIIATDPTATDVRGDRQERDPARAARRPSPTASTAPSGASGFANPCTTVKAGATRISRDVIDETTGQPATLYLNVARLGEAAAGREGRHRPNRVALGSCPGGLTVARYAP